jgi:hypothetical protein
MLSKFADASQVKVAISTAFSGSQTFSVLSSEGETARRPSARPSSTSESAEAVPKSERGSQEEVATAEIHSVEAPKPLSEDTGRLQGIYPCSVEKIGACVPLTTIIGV